MTEEELKKEALFSGTKARKVHRLMRERVSESAENDLKDLKLDEARRWLEWRRQGLDKMPIGA